MTLRKYLILGSALVLIFVFSFFAVLMNEIFIWKMVFSFIVLIVSLGFVAFATAFDHFLQTEKVNQKMIAVDDLLAQAINMNNLGVEVFSLELSNLNNRVLDIKSSYAEKHASITSAIFDLNLLEKDLVHLVEIQSIVKKLKDFLDLSRKKFGNSNFGGDRVRLAISEIENRYHRSINYLPGLVYPSGNHKLNFYRTLLRKSESIFLTLERGR